MKPTKLVIRVINMVNAICLDTRIVSRFLAKKTRAIELIQQYKNADYEIYTTTVNVSELIMGLWKIGPISEHRMAELKDFFTDLHVRPFDFDAAIMAGKLHGDILRGKEIGWRDTFIAAIVLVHGKKIITSNSEHFARIPDIEVITYD
nr:type II toxin-antitoxin system VapC family toxin [Candidatus Sigynarchaeota archaeon]